MPQPDKMRKAAKVILLDESEAVLLFCGGDPSRPQAGTWWFLPGGGLDPGETVEDAARREVWEETGHEVDAVGSVIHRRQVEFRFIDEVLHSDESYFLVRVTRFEVSSAEWTELERQSIVGHRWWTVSELQTTNDTIYPDELPDLIEAHS